MCVCLFQHLLSHGAGYALGEKDGRDEQSSDRVKRRKEKRVTELL